MTEEYLNHMSDRIAVLEQLVGSLLEIQGLHPNRIRKWKECVANWEPGAPETVTEATIRLQEEANAFAAYRK